MNKCYPSVFIDLLVSLKLIFFVLLYNHNSLLREKGKLRQHGYQLCWLSYDRARNTGIHSPAWRHIVSLFIACVRGNKEYFSDTFVVDSLQPWRGGSDFDPTSPEVNNEDPRVSSSTRTRQRVYLAQVWQTHTEHPNNGVFPKLNL